MPERCLQGENDLTGADLKIEKGVVIRMGKTVFMFPDRDPNILAWERILRTDPYL